MQTQDDPSISERLSKLPGGVRAVAVHVQGIDDAARRYLDGRQSPEMRAVLSLWMDHLRNLSHAAEELQGAANACIRTMRQVIANGEEA